MEAMTLKTKNNATSEAGIFGLFKSSINLAGDADTIFKVKETLLMLALEFIRSERIDGAKHETRSDFSFHLAVLNDIMNNLSECAKLPEDEKLLFFENFTKGCSEHAENIKETLNALSLVYIRSEQIEGSNQVLRNEIADHFYILDCLIADRILYAQLNGLS
jgi:hypothetical protein